MSVIQLHALGYCDVCRRPFKLGDAIATPRSPDGSHGNVHPACMGCTPIDPDPPEGGGTPVALAV